MLNQRNNKVTMLIANHVRQLLDEEKTYLDMPQNTPVHSSSNCHLSITWLWLPFITTARACILAGYRTDRNTLPSTATQKHPTLLPGQTATSV